MVFSHPSADADSRFVYGQPYARTASASQLSTCACSSSRMHTCQHRCVKQHMHDSLKRTALLSCLVWSALVRSVWSLIHSALWFCQALYQVL